MKLETLEDLYLEQLKDLYSAETQLIEALPKMAQAATDARLKAVFENHLAETKGQAQRLEQIGQQLGSDLSGHLCKGMQGILIEGTELLEEASEADPDVFNAALITSAQRVEHYEIAGYGTVCAYAEKMGLGDHKVLLGESLEEEKSANETLRLLALGGINDDAASA